MNTNNITRLHKGSIVTIVVAAAAAALLGLIGVVPASALAATAPTLGTVGTYGIVSDTWTNSLNAALETAIIGGVLYHPSRYATGIDQRCDRYTT